MEATGKTVHWIETPEMKVEMSGYQLNRMAMGGSAVEAGLDMDLVHTAIGHTVFKDKQGLEGDSFYHSILRILPDGSVHFVKPRTLLIGPTQVCICSSAFSTHSSLCRN